jgi:hypothetical protein
MARQPKEKPEFNITSILNNPVDSKTLKGFIDEALLHKNTIANANAGISDIRNEAKEQLGIPPAQFMHMVNTKFKESLKKEKDKVDVTEGALGKLYGDSAVYSGDDYQHDDE